MPRFRREGLHNYLQLLSGRMGNSYADAKIRYEERQKIARDSTWDDLLLRVVGGSLTTRIWPCRFSAIATEELDVADGWTLPWRDKVWQFKPYPRRFELAIWYGDELHALCLARASKGKENVAIYLLERKRGDDRFKGLVALIAVDAVERYAKLLECQKVILKDPAPGTLPFYESLGFSLAVRKGPSICYERSVK